MAGYFNQTFGRVFPLPEHRLDKEPVVPGIDGKKMSKSYGNTIEIFAEGKALQSSVMRIVTDSTPVEATKDPAKDNVFALYSLFATQAEREALAGKYRAGGFGYGEAKKMLIAKIDGHFAEAREKRKMLAADPAVVDATLARGAERARTLAIETMREVRQATGLR
jgi:tryptophanyl-tRNA synthetase